MCGIVASLSASGGVSREAVERATRALHHRGPDGCASWIAPHGGVGLGHARLSIIDLSTGGQPIANEDESLHVVVNGELYDYERIQRELAARGHRFRTQSDSEIVLHLYEELGEECLRELRGEFAFALWDERRRVLFAARDRFGIKPLFYARVGDTLLVASEAKALFAAGVEARWDRDAVFQELIALSDASRTMFEGVYQVPPGHYLRASAERFDVVPYWELPFPTAGQPESAGTEAEHVERFREVLLESIRLRMRADVPVGFYLSGGIDSCAVLGMAASLGASKLDAFTIAFEDAAGIYDESAHARAMAKHVGATCHVLPMSESLLSDEFVNAVAHSETVATNLHGVAKHLLSRKVRDAGFKAVLTGDGADEILGGYVHFRLDAIASTATEEGARKKRVAALLQANRHLGAFGAPAGEMLSTAAIERAFGYVPTFVRTSAMGGKRRFGLLSPAFAAEFAERDAFQRLVESVPGATKRLRDPLHVAMALWMSSFFPNKLLNYLGDRSEMAHSVEGRVPLLDHEVAELALRMPLAMKDRETADKYVLREAAKPFVTKAAYERPKHPFVAPLVLGGRMREVLFDTLQPSRLAAQPFFDVEKVTKLLATEPSASDVDARSGHFTTLLALASVCVLQERYRL